MSVHISSKNEAVARPAKNLSIGCRNPLEKSEPIERPTDQSPPVRIRDDRHQHQLQRTNHVSYNCATNESRLAQAQQEKNVKAKEEEKADNRERSYAGQQRKAQRLHLQGFLTYYDITYHDI